MPGAHKAAAPSKSGSDPVSFEDALKQLESIVEAMEAGELPLESLLVKFEEGTKLAQLCQARLADAELKIQQLERNAAGDPVLKPFAVAADED
jgi:exodeoxyribonuclease VII small subunit